MPLTPQITLTAKLQDVSGNAVGAVGKPGHLRVALCGFGPVLPCVPGTCNIDKPGPIDIPSTDGTISIKLWGNDVITPAGTYYAIELLDDAGNVVMTGAYQFTGSNVTIDLSSAVQIVAPYGVAIGLLRVVACTGATPGSTYVAPGARLIIAVFLNGTLIYPVTDYGTSASTINLTFTTETNDAVSALIV